MIVCDIASSQSPPPKKRHEPKRSEDGPLSLETIQTNKDGAKSSPSERIKAPKYTNSRKGTVQVR